MAVNNLVNEGRDGLKYVSLFARHEDSSPDELGLRVVEGAAVTSLPVIPFRPGDCQTLKGFLVI